MTIGGAVPPPLTGPQYAVRGEQPGTVCCPSDQVFYYQPAKSHACCDSMQVFSGGISYCPSADGLDKFSHGYVYPTIPGPSTRPLSATPPYPQL